MNLVRGFFRLWVAASVAWIGYWSWKFDLPMAISGWWQDTSGRLGALDPKGYLILTASIIFGAPLLIGIAMVIVGATVVWIVRGFRKT